MDWSPLIREQRGQVWAGTGDFPITEFWFRLQFINIHFLQPQTFTFSWKISIIKLLSCDIWFLDGSLI